MRFSGTFGQNSYWWVLTPVIVALAVMIGLAYAVY
jgi:hypothetical protein